MIATRFMTGPYLYIKEQRGSPIAHPYLFSQRHILNLLAQRSPIISLKLSILYTLLTPVLMQPADLVLGLLEEDQLIPDALFDEDSSGMLIDD